MLKSKNCGEQAILFPTAHDKERDEHMIYPEDEVYGDQDERENVEGAYEKQEVETWPSPETRVRAGVEWLYEVEPNWLSRIDLDRLNISSGAHCIAAQLEDFCYICFFDRHGFEIGSERNRFMKKHGFVGVTEDDSDDTTLTVAWKLAITALRG